MRGEQAIACVEGRRASVLDGTCLPASGAAHRVPQVRDLPRSFASLAPAHLALPGSPVAAATPCPPRHSAVRELGSYRMVSP
jgi:hypothetical protein